MSFIDRHKDKRVIIQGNNEPVWVGVLKGINETTGWPLVENARGDVMVSAGIVLPYSNEMYGFLRGLDTKMAWNILSDALVFRDEIKYAGQMIKDEARGENR